MARIEYIDDVGGNFQEAHGSDSRLNVSSRADNRAYYNSRDQAQAYTWVYSHTASAAGEYSLYLQNTSVSKTLVISSIGCNSDLGVNVKLWFATGTATNGSSITGTNLNKSSSNVAAATAIEHADTTALGGFSLDVIIDYLTVNIKSHEEFRLSDRLRLGQNDAIVLEVDAATSGTPLVYGVVFGYFE